MEFTRIYNEMNTDRVEAEGLQRRSAAHTHMRTCTNVHTARANTHTHKAEHALGGPAGGAPVAGGGGAVGGKLRARGGGGAARARHGGAGAVGAEAPGRALGRAGTEVARGVASGSCRAASANVHLSPKPGRRARKLHKQSCHHDAAGIPTTPVFVVNMEPDPEENCGIRLFCPAKVMVCRLKVETVETVLSAYEGVLSGLQIKNLNDAPFYSWT